MSENCETYFSNKTMLVQSPNIYFHNHINQQNFMNEEPITVDQLFAFQNIEKILIFCITSNIWRQCYNSTLG